MMKRHKLKEAAQSAQLADLAQQIDGLSQQAATFAANDEAAQAEEMAQSQRLNIMQGQIDTLGQQVAALAVNDEAAQS